MQFSVALSSDPTASPDSGQLTDAERQEVLDTMKAATTVWSWYLTASNITLDLVININNSAYSGNTLATGGPANFYTNGTTFQGAKVDYAGSDIKLASGNDPNGASADLHVTLTVNAIENLLYFRPGPTATVAPYTVAAHHADALSVFEHEVGHGLGIVSVSKTVTDSTFPTNKTVYDTFIDSNSNFTGSHALAAVGGGPIQLDPASISHLSESGSFASDLMSGTITSGTQTPISALDLGILQDIGVPLRKPTSGDDVIHALGSAAISLGDGNDFVYVDYNSVSVDGGAGIDTAVFSANRSGYTITQTSTGNFSITGPDGSETLSHTEYAQFADSTVRLLPGSGTTVDFAAAPSTYMSAIRDFDGNDLGAAGSWVLIGSTDVNNSGSPSHIYINSAIGRWAEIGTAADGMVYFNDYNWAGVTRVVGIYVDPQVQSGAVAQGSASDSQRRFQNDLQIGNVAAVLGSGDYDRDGFEEIYFRLTDGTAYLHAYMWGDGNIRYANYQSAQQVKDYLSANGYGAATWGNWFPSADTLASTPGDTMAVSLPTPFDPMNQNASVLAGVAV